MTVCAQQGRGNGSSHATGAGRLAICPGSVESNLRSLIRMLFVSSAGRPVICLGNVGSNVRNSTYQEEEGGNIISVASQIRSRQLNRETTTGNRQHRTRSPQVIRREGAANGVDRFEGNRCEGFNRYGL